MQVEHKEKIQMPHRLHRNENSIKLFAKKISLVFDIKEQNVVT
jgi:hypothetical protein